MNRRLDPTDLIAGAVFVLIGLFFGLQSLGLDIGTSLRMGPGYFPLVLSGVLILLGVVVLVRAAVVDNGPMEALAWRGMLFILPAPVFFGLTVRGLGFVPSLFFTALIAAGASHKMTLVKAILLAFAVTIFSTLVFSYALGLPFQRFGRWWPF